jgi:heavy metal translocating P-type ATPase
MSENVATDRTWLTSETLIAVLAVVGMLVHLVLRFGFESEAQNWPLFAVLALGGTPLLFELLKQLLKREFGADWLAGISIVSSVLLGEYLAGSIIVLMLSGGEALERYAAGRASSVLRALAKRMPNIAHRMVDGAPVDIEVEDIALNDNLVIMPHEICPADGEVIEGHGVMDESFLTGEPYMLSKAPGSSVISGAVNGETALTIRVEKLPKDSRYAHIMEVMKESEQKRPRIRRLADQLGAFYTPMAVGVGLLAWWLSGDPHRFLAVVIVATPCPLLISIPVALIGAISLAAKRGIIIKDPRVLEQIGQVRTLIIDKTGTLTSGRPAITDIDTSGDANQILSLAAALEQYSKHPLSQAIVSEAQTRGLKIQPASSISERPGQGLTGVVGSDSIRITSRNKLAKAEHPDVEKIPPVQSGLECVVLVNEAYAATFRFHDQPRAEGRAFIQHLAPMHNFHKIMLVSGDRLSEVEYLAKIMGITDIHAEQSPEQKVEIVRIETTKDKTLFVGDGINDAPAMTNATVGIAFGQTHEITAEAAGAVLLDPSLVKLDELIHISQRMRRVALQSALGGMGLSMIGMGFAAFGLLPAVAGAIAQEFIDLLAVLNALRTSRASTLSDVPQKKV